MIFKKIYNAENNPLANCSIYYLKCKIFKKKNLAVELLDIDLVLQKFACLLRAVMYKAYLAKKKKSIPSSPSSTNQSLFHFIALSALSSQPFGRAGGKECCFKKLNILNTPTAKAEKDIQHSENKALLRSSKNKPAVVLYSCVKITKWKQEMLV